MKQLCEEQINDEEIPISFACVGRKSNDDFPLSCNQKLDKLSVFDDKNDR